MCQYLSSLGALGTLGTTLWHSVLALTLHFNQNFWFLTISAFCTLYICVLKLWVTFSLQPCAFIAILILSSMFYLPVLPKAFCSKGLFLFKQSAKTASFTTTHWRHSLSLINRTFWPSGTLTFTFTTLAWRKHNVKCNLKKELPLSLWKTAAEILLVTSDSSSEASFGDASFLFLFIFSFFFIPVYSASKQQQRAHSSFSS